MTNVIPFRPKGQPVDTERREIDLLRRKLLFWRLFSVGMVIAFYLWAWVIR